MGIDIPQAPGIYSINLMPLEVDDSPEQGSALFVLTRVGREVHGVLDLRDIKPAEALTDRTKAIAVPVEVRVEDRTLEGATRQVISQIYKLTRRTILSIELMGSARIARA